MEFSIESYPLIDYRTWVLGDACRRAVNLKRLNMLNREELALVDISSKYQDPRNDSGHGEFSVYTALNLLQYFPDAKREIVVPATWMHDMGFHSQNPNEWKRLVEEAVLKGNLKAMDDESKRRPHQNRGCFLAGRLLERLASEQAPHRERIEDYDWEIADAIGDHDTRKLPPSVNGKILRISDLLWRASYPHAQAYMADWTLEKILKRFYETCLESEAAHLEEIGCKVAKLEFTNTMVHKFWRDMAWKILSRDFPKEVERVIEFYKIL